MRLLTPTPGLPKPLLAIHLRLSFADGTRKTLEMLAPSTAAAIDAAQQKFGDDLRGSSAQLLFAPGFEISRARRPMPTKAANEEQFSPAAS